MLNVKIKTIHVLTNIEHNNNNLRMDILRVRTVCIAEKKRTADERTIGRVSRAVARH